MDALNEKNRQAALQTRNSSSDENAIPTIKTTVEKCFWGGGFKSGKIDGDPKEYKNEYDYKKALKRAQAKADGKVMFGSVAPDVEVEVLKRDKIEFPTIYRVGVKECNTAEEARLLAEALKTAQKSKIEEKDDPFWGKSYVINGMPYHYNTRQEAEDAHAAIKGQDSNIKKIDARNFQPECFVVDGQTYWDKSAARVAAAQAQKKLTKLQQGINESDVGGRVVNDGKGWGKFEAKIDGVTYYDRALYEKELAAAKLEKALSKIENEKRQSEQSSITPAMEQHLRDQGFTQEVINNVKEKEIKEKVLDFLKHFKRQERAETLTILLKSN